MQGRRSKNCRGCRLWYGYLSSLSSIYFQNQRIPNPARLISLQRSSPHPKQPSSPSTPTTILQQRRSLTQRGNRNSSCRPQGKLSNATQRLKETLMPVAFPSHKIPTDNCLAATDAVQAAASELVATLLLCTLWNKSAMWTEQAPLSSQCFRIQYVPLLPSFQPVGPAVLALLGKSLCTGAVS